jgi:hypothetical protein
MKHYFHDECMLKGYRHKCSTIIDDHHLINKQKLPKGSSARYYAEHFHPEIFIVPVCRIHNSVTKEADTKIGRKLITMRLNEIFGIGYVKDVIDGLQKEFEAYNEYTNPIPYPELSFKGIMAAPLPD